MRAVLADLHAAAAFTNPATVGRVPPPPYARSPYVGTDHVHTSSGAQHLFSRADAGVALPPAAAAVVRASRAALAALRAAVRDGRVYFVVLHPPRGRVPAKADFFASAVLLWAVGVSAASGNLLGAWALADCCGVCD